MGTYNPNYKSAFNPLRGPRGPGGLRSTVITGVSCTLNLQVSRLSQGVILPEGSRKLGGSGLRVFFKGFAILGGTLLES